MSSAMSWRVTPASFSVDAGPLAGAACVFAVGFAETPPPCGTTALRITFENVFRAPVT